MDYDDLLVDHYFFLDSEMKLARNQLFAHVTNPLLCRSLIFVSFVSLF